MSKVYIVTEGEYSDYHIEGVFSTKELAETFVNGHDDVSIEEYDVDKRKRDKRIFRYCAEIDLHTGDIIDTGKLSEYKSEHDDINIYADDEEAILYSTKSEKHAIKLACEYRQKWLRDHQYKGK